MPTRPKAHYGELGAPGITSSLDGWIDTGERTLELQWPHSVHTYDAMRNDSHIEGCLDAITLLIEGSAWDLDPDSLQGVRPEVIDLVRQDLDLPEPGAPRRIRPRGSIDFDEFLRHSLLELVFGHMVFEQVYELIDGKARLRKLAPRMPKTISGFELDRHGGLRAMKQLVPQPNGMWDQVIIPIDRLVVFTRRKEGSDPTGRSILRSCYLDWHLKQKMVRIDAIAADRHGTGVPEVTYSPEGMTKREALDIASNVRTGEYAGVALEEGVARLDIKGVEGQLHKTLDSIKYHDQEISRRMLANFLDLGHDNGARALGDTFLDFFVKSLQATANYHAGIINEHVIRDLVELNYGPTEPYPLVRCDEISADSVLSPEGLKALADAGYILPDPTLEAWFRSRYGMPMSDIPGRVGTVIDQVDEGPAAGTIEEIETQLAAWRAGPRARTGRVASGS